MSKKRFIIVSSLILSFPLAYKLLNPMPSATVAPITIKTTKKTESYTENLGDKSKKSIEQSITPPAPSERPQASATESPVLNMMAPPEQKIASTVPTPIPTQQIKATTKTEEVIPEKVEVSAKKVEIKKPTPVVIAKPDVNQKAQAILAKAPTLDPKVLKLALTAYSNAHKKGMTSKGNILTIIDYSKPSDHKRLWVLDLNKNQILYNTFAAHGKNTGDRYAKSFSNQVNSKASSIGLFITKQTYQGNHGLSLRIHGLDKGFNDNALRRAVVFHGANYVNEYVAKSYGRIGRSWGCPAVPQQLSKPIINTIKNGTLVFAYAPGLMYEMKSKFLKG